MIEAEQWTAGKHIEGLCMCRDVPDAPHIHTLEGAMTVSEGDFVVTGLKGERYPCKPDIFAMKYEADV